MRWPPRPTSSWPGLLAGNLRQVSESGWTAADHLARAVAPAEGWPCDTGGKFLEVMRNAAAQSGDGSINELTGPAHMLRENSEGGLDQETIRERVRCVAGTPGATGAK